MPCLATPCRASVLDREVSAGVDPLAEVFTGLEVRDMLARERYRLSGLRVTADPGRPEMQGEAAESADLDTFALGERIAHQVEEMLDREFNVLGGEVLLLSRNHLDQF